MSDVRDPTDLHIWPLARPVGHEAELIYDPVVQSLALILLASVFFLVFPTFDLWLSGLFYQPGYGFPIGRLPISQGLRAVGNDLTRLIVVVLLVVVILKIALPARPSLVPPRDTLFILATLAIGPGLIVNLIFKDHWGRPRPVMIENFSNAYPFVGAWHMSGACSTNCSFVSGEASSALWLVTTVVLLPPAWRATAVKAILGLALLLSLNRIAAGGHFLSDVLIAWGITLAVIATAYRYLYVTPPAALAVDNLEGGLTRFGEAIRTLFRRITERPSA